MRTGYINGIIITNDNEISEAMIVNESKFEFVGDNNFVKNAGISIVDLKGKTVLPGFYDSHIHFLGIGLVKNLTDLTSCSSIEGIISAYKNTDNQWLIGRGWHQSNINGLTPTKSDLDKVSLTKPVIATRVCGHVLVANSKAMEIAGIDDSTAQIDGGSLDFESGLFTEDALKLITACIPTYNKQNIKEMFILANSLLLRNGVTHVATDDFSTLNVPYELILECLKELYDDNQIQVRVYEQVNLPKIELFKDYIAKGYPNKILNDKFKLGPLKLLADGSLGGRTAYLRENYSDANTKGIPIFTQENLNEFVELADMANMNVAIHAIGDATIEMILDATKSSKNHRHGIIHAQIVDKEQIKRIKKQGISLYVQPIFLNSDLDILNDRLGERKNESYLFKTMYDSGINTSFGTDCPVEDFNPFENIYCAVSRKSIKNPDLPIHLENESFTILEAIDAYTNKSAYHSYDENILGKIKKGYFADYIIIDKDLTNGSNKDLLNTKVLETFINGEKVY